MKDITKFIIEKLKLSKDTKSNTSFEPSDPDGFDAGDHCGSFGARASDIQPGLRTARRNYERHGALAAFLR